MTAWNEFSAADFDASKADKRAARAARAAADAGQSGLFFVPTPARPAKTTPDPKRLPDDVALFDLTGDDQQ